MLTGYIVYSAKISILNIKILTKEIKNDVKNLYANN